MTLSFLAPMTAETAALVSASLLMWVALVHLVMAGGLRSGELVWSGRQPRRLDASLRLRSLVYAMLLLGSALILGTTTGLLSWRIIPGHLVRSATFSVSAVLGVATIYGLGWGSRWERMFFAPITLLGAFLAGWMTLG